MFKSIRSIFLGWHTVILVVVLLGFGGTLFHLQRQATFKEVDTELNGIAQMVMATPQHTPRRLPWFVGGGVGPDVALREYFDTEKEGRLSANERAAAWMQRFERLDTNHDGQLSAEEVAAIQRPLWLLPAPRFELPEPLRRRLRSDATESLYFVIWHPHGGIVAAANAPDDLSQPLPPPGKHMPRSYTRQRGIWRELVVMGAPDTLALVGKSMQQENERLSHLLWRLIGTGGGVLACGLVGGWALAQRVTRPITTISTTAAAISASDLSRRIDIPPNTSELGQLAQVLNSMFARLEAAFAQQTQFTADASHELRTPVSIMLAQTELALNKQRSAAEYREALEACLRASKRMKSLVDNLLTMAQIDAGTFPLQPQPFDFHSLVEECVALLTPMATERHVVMRCAVQSVSWVGDADRLAQVLINLLTNAIHYNQEGGDILVTLESASQNQEVVLTVADTGVGIAPEDLPHIFDRFYRVDKARSRALGGSGLGLPICQYIVAAHGGTLTCQSTVHVGTTFSVRLPTIPATA